MIDKAAALHSVPLALIAANKGLVVSPVPGTPVAELVKISNDILFNTSQAYLTTASGEEVVTEFANLVELYTAGKNNPTEHDQTIDAFVDQISKAVRSHISFAKNVTTPFIVSMAEYVTRTMEDVKPLSSDFNIEVYDIPKPMQNSGFESSISKYEGVAYIAPESEFRLGELSPQELLETLQTGSKDYDERISEWFISKGDLFFLDLWNNIFRDFKESKPSVVYKLNDIYRTPEAIDYALAIHLIARKLYDDVPENTGLPLNKFKTLMAQYRDSSGVKLFQEYAQYTTTITIKTLVKSIHPSGKGCTVNGPVYREWLKGSGCNEVLLGMLVGNKLIYSQPLIDNQRDVFLKNWNDFNLFNKTTEKNKAFNRFKDVLVLAFSNELDHVAEEEKDLINSSPDYTQKVKCIFNEELAKVTTKDMEDVYGVCIRLICRARFFYTDCEKIINAINEASISNPDIDVREAALLSTIEYVIDYICDQLTITSN